MTTLIINLPHLQSRRQRHGALLLSLLCWGWFLMPLVIVGGWLLGFHVLAQEVVWLGGWRSLQYLAGVATSMILVLVGLWTLWTMGQIARGARVKDKPALVPPGEVSQVFGVTDAMLAMALPARLVTVHFGAGGGITGITPDADLGRVRRPRRQKPVTADPEPVSAIG